MENSLPEVNNETQETTPITRRVARPRHCEGKPAAGTPPTEAVEKLAQWAKEAKQRSVPSVPDDPRFMSQYPTLWTFLTYTAVDGILKQPSRFSVTCDGGVFRFTFADPTAKKTFTITALTFEEGMARLDRAITSSDTVWSTIGRRQQGWQKVK